MRLCVLLPGLCLLLLLSLAGCKPAAAPATAGTAPAAAPATAHAVPTVFQDQTLGLSVAAVPGMTLRRDFDRNYLDTDGWKAFAPADSHGRPLAALVLDGSNDVTAAELRIARSDDSRDVAQCLDPPAEVVGEPDQVQIGGVSFVHFRAADAAMSHYVQVDGYRSVRNGRCAAIDLMVSGTRPEVYDPPRRAPFDAADAARRLQKALAALHWN